MTAPPMLMPSAAAPLDALAVVEAMVEEARLAIVELAAAALVVLKLVVAVP